MSHYFPAENSTLKWPNIKQAASNSETGSPEYFTLDRPKNYA